MLVGSMKPREALAVFLCQDQEQPANIFFMP